MTDDDEESKGRDRLVFWLPPITLPPLFPEDFRFDRPIPERARGGGNVLFAAVVLDVLDAVAVIAAGGDPIRVVLGTLLSVVLVGPLGLAYAWEAVAMLGVPWLGVAPTATALVLLDARR